MYINKNFSIFTIRYYKYCGQLVLDILRGCSLFKLLTEPFDLHFYRNVFLSYEISIH